jgi:hypothetical protein
MPKLPNPKHEAFALSLSQGKSQTAAYIDGFKVERASAGTNASKLLRDAVRGPLIRERVAELCSIRAKVEADEKAVRDGTVRVSRAWIIQKLQLIAETAIDAGRHAPAARALELLGKEIGMFTDLDDRKVSLESLSMDDLLKLSNELERDLADE